MNNPIIYSYKFDRFHLSITERTLYEEVNIRLSDTQFRTLLKLVESNGELINKKELAKAVGTPTSGPNIVEVAITALRDKLRDPKEVSRLIKTETGGYRFVADVIRVQDEGSDEDRDRVTKTAQIEADNLEDNDSKDGIIRFRELWRDSGKVVKWWLSLGVIITVALSVALLIEVNTRKGAMPLVGLAQACVLLVAAVGTFGSPKGFRQIKADNEEAERLNENIKKATGYEDPLEWIEARDIAEDAMKRFRRYWRGIILTWLLLYICLALQGLPNLNSSSQQVITPQALKTVLSMVSGLISNLNTMLIILCYDVLNKPIEIKKGRHTIGDSPLTTGLAFVLIFLVIEFFVIFSIGFEKREVADGFNLAIGIAGGIAMALYAGRLQSKFLGPPHWLVISLYSYTAIQALYVYLGEHLDDAGILKAVILMDAALVLKCLLYIYLAMLLKSGRLLFYFVRVRRTYQKVGMEWQNFQQVLEQEN